MSKDRLFPLRLGIRQGSPLLPLLDCEIKQGNKIKIMQIRKEEKKLSLFADDIMVHIENPKESQKKPQKPSQDRLIQQCHKIQDQYTKIDCILYTL